MAKNPSFQHKKLHLPSTIVPNVIPEIISTPVKATWIRVTPEMAFKWLDEANTKNRKVRTRNVMQMAADMVAGKWRGTNGQPIHFDTLGRLVNGQHRLWACVESKVPFDTLMVTGVDPEDYSTIDTGKTKTMADHLGPMQDEKNVFLLAATIRLVHVWERKQLDRHRNLQPTMAELEETYRSHPQIAPSVNRMMSMHATRKLFTASYASLIHYAACMQGHSARVEHFMDALGTGVGLYQADPIYQFRKFLLAQKAAQGGRVLLRRSYVLALGIKAWNACKEEKPLKSLGFKEGEEFPEL